jgi:uncharacterized small protein (DUF1192 family)
MAADTPLTLAAALDADVRALFTAVRSACDRVSSLRAQTAALRARADDSPEIAVLSAEQLSARIASLSAERARLEADYARRLCSLSALRERREALEAELSALSGGRASAERAAGELRARASALDARLAGLAAQIAEVRLRAQRQTEGIEDHSIALSAYAAEVRAARALAERAEAGAERASVSRLAAALALPAGGVAALAFGPGWRSVVAAGAGGRLCQLALPRLAELAGFSTQAAAHAFRVHADGDRVALAGADGAVRIASLARARVLSEPGSHADACTDCHWASPNQLLTASRDRCVKIWDVNTGGIVGTVMAMSPVASLCETGNARLFAAACADGSIRMIDLREKGVVLRFDRVHAKPLTCVAYAPMEDMLYSLGRDAAIAVTSLAGGARVRQLAHPELAVTAPMARFSIDPLGRFLAAGSASGAVVVFDLLREGNARVLPHHQAAVLATACAANLIVAADQKGNVSFWS